MSKTKKEIIAGESYVSLKMLEQSLRSAREAGANDGDHVLFGHMNIDGTFSPDGHVLALGWTDGVVMVIVKDSVIPVLN